MKINQVIVNETKQRLDPKCWSGHHKEGTKIKGGVRVNNCVPNESVEEGENWSKHNNPRAGGMSQKSVKSYRRSHPGSKIQTAVTTKPSKLKKGSKAAKRRASFCARMRGMKKHRTGAKTARDPNSNINKSLRRWHCESVEDLQQLVMIAEQKISEAKNLAQQAAIAIAKKNKKKVSEQGVSEESKGLWANIHAKRERIKHGSGEHMRKPGSKGAPTADALKKSATESTEQNPFEKGSMGDALWKALSKTKKASPAQQQRNRERFAKRDAEKLKQQGVEENVVVPPVVPVKGPEGKLSPEQEKSIKRDAKLLGKYREKGMSVGSALDRFGKFKQKHNIKEEGLTEDEAPGAYADGHREGWHYGKEGNPYKRGASWTQGMDEYERKSKEQQWEQGRRDAKKGYHAYKEGVAEGVNYPQKHSSWSVHSPKKNEFNTRYKLDQEKEARAHAERIGGKLVKIDQHGVAIRKGSKGDRGVAEADAAPGSKGYRVTWTEAGQKSTTGLLMKPDALTIAKKLQTKPGASDVKVVPYRDVSEGHADQQRKIVKKNGKPVGEVGIDRESSPGVGQWYMKHYASGQDLSGYNSMEEALEELKHCLTQGVAEDTLNELVPNDQWYIVMHDNLDTHGMYHGKGDDVTGPLAKVQASAQLHKLHPYDKNWTIVPASKMQNKPVAEDNSNQSAYLQGAKDIIKGADPHHIARVRNLDPETLQRYVKLVWDKIDSKEYNYRKPDLVEVKDDDEDDGLIGGRYTPEQWAKMINNLKKKAQEQDAKKKEQEKPKDLGESTEELNNIVKLSGNNK